MSTLLVFFVITQQWSTPVNLGIAGVDDMYPQTCHKQQMYSNEMCLVWQALQGSDWEIYSRFSSGYAWSDTVRITDNSPDDTRPRVAYDVNTNCFWCVWVRNNNIFAAYSTGNTWSSSEQITSGSPVDGLPSIHCMSGEIWVVWQRIVSDSVNIYSSYRSGGAWSSPIPVTQEVNVDNTLPKVGESQTRILAVWERNDDIYYSTYVNSAWQTPQPITSSAANDSAPEIGCSDFGGTAVCWQTDEHGDWEVYRTATDTFATHHRVTNHTADDVTPYPLFYAVPIFQWDVPMIAFTSDRNGNPDIFSWIDWQGFEPVDEDSGQDLYPVLTANLDVYLWALWQTDRNSEWDIYGSYKFIPGSVAETDANAVDIVCTAIPNPVSGKASIVYATTAPGIVSLDAFNAAGQKIETLVHSFQAPGNHIAVWVTDHLPSGVYFLKLQSGQGTATEKVTLVE